jgi:hypothetical protein
MAGGFRPVSSPLWGGVMPVTPAEGGGAMIMDKYPRKSDTVSNEETGQHCLAADEEAQTA